MSLTATGNDDCGYGDLLTISPSTAHTHTIILLHGRGSNAADFRDELLKESTTAEGSLPILLPSVRWVLPSAPTRFSTVFQEENTEWFDIYSLTHPETRQDLQLQGLRESVQMVKQIAVKESGLVPVERIFIGGISQGGAVAALALLETDLAWAGFIGIACWLPFATQIQDILAADRADDPSQVWHKMVRLLRTTLQPDVRQSLETVRVPAALPPVFLTHGVDDEVIDISLGQVLCKVLQILGANVVWKQYEDCGHWIKVSEGVEALARFAAACIRGDAEQ